MNLDWSNKKVIITGGSTGIGKEVVTLVATNGAKVAIFDVNDTEGIELTNQLNKDGHEIRYWHVDVRDSNQVSGGVMAAEQWLEGVDILINLAGILQGASINIEEFPDEVWDSVVGINLTGSYLMVKHVSNYMIKQKSWSKKILLQEYFRLDLKDFSVKMFIGLKLCLVAIICLKRFFSKNIW